VRSFAIPYKDAASGFNEPSRISAVCHWVHLKPGDGCTPSPALWELSTFLRSWKVTLRLRLRHLQRFQLV
jgi:hypothetical protein